MSGPAITTAFVTEAAGFLGTALVRALVGRGVRVFGLTSTREGGEVVRSAGGTAVLGHLLTAERWQDEAAADWVFCLSPHSFVGRRVTRRQAAAMAAERVSMDAHLLDAVAAGGTRRIVYVADTSYYGATGVLQITEDSPPQPSLWGRRLVPALDRLDGYAVTGLPIVTAFPGWVYGNGSWCRLRVIEPILAGRPILEIGRSRPWVSPIHVTDCAGALVHLAERGRIGQRYFLVNDAPIRLPAFAATFARLADRRLRVRRVPTPIVRPLVGAVLHEHLTADAVYSASRLRSLGFRFRYPTLEEGFTEVLRSLNV